MAEVVGERGLLVAARNNVEHCCCSALGSCGLGRPEALWMARSHLPDRIQRIQANREKEKTSEALTVDLAPRWDLNPRGRKGQQLSWLNFDERSMTVCEGLHSIW